MFKTLYFLFIFLILLVPALVIGQEQQQMGLDFLQKMDAPKIIKNNLRITKLEINKVDVLPNNEISISGKMEIRNYSDSPTSRLNTAVFSGLKEDSYYLKYPIYSREMSEDFVLEPKQIIVKDFSFVGKDLSRFGEMGIEAWVVDEYEKRSHVESIIIPKEFLQNNNGKGEIISDTVSTLSVNGVKVSTNTGPTFYPESEDMYIDVEFQSQIPQTISGAKISVFERNHFTNPIHEQSVDLEKISPSTLQIKIPENFKAGVYPFELELISSDENIFIPRIYGRFIVWGNMAKVTDVVLNLEESKTKSITLVVQGNPQDFLNRERESSVKFSSEISLLGKNDKILATKRIDNQEVEIYKNIEIEFDEEVKTTKINKIKVDLLDEKGVFSTYEKEFTHKKEFNYWSLLLILLIPFVVLIVLRLRNKNKNTLTLPILILFLSFSFINFADAGMTPEPGFHFGAYVYDAYDLDPYSKSEYNYNCTTTCPTAYENDIDILRIDGDEILDLFDIDLAFEQPIFSDQDPNFCYAPGQIVPVVFTHSYGICTNSPVSCIGTKCTDGGSEFTTTKVYLSVDTDQWYWNLRNWDYDTDSINNPQFTALPTLTPDNYKDFDLEEMYNYIGVVESQSNLDYLYELNGTQASSLDIVNANSYRIAKIKEKIIDPVNSNNVEVSIIQNGSTVMGSSDYIIVMPQEPGSYKINSSMQFERKTGTGYYMSQHTIRVCETKHDADVVMPGAQYIDVDGNLRDEDSSILSGYMLHKFPISSSFIPPSYKITPNYDAEGNLISTSPEVWGFNAGRFNEFTFASVANYCGYELLPLTSSPPPTPSDLNSWVNYYSTATDLNEKMGHNNLIDFMDDLIYYTLNKTWIPVFAHYYDGTKWLTTKATTTPEVVKPKSANYDYVVHNTSGGLRFINLLSDLNFSGGILDLPKQTLDEVLNLGILNYSNYIKAGENNSTNTFLIKENIKNGRNYYTCSLYEDFCPDVEGIQYVNVASSKLRLYSIDSNGNHSFASSTSYFSSPAVASQMCSVISPVSVTCSVTSPSDIDSRNINTEIEFKANVVGANPALQTTYVWTGATPRTDQSFATASYTSIGAKTATVQVTNGSYTKTATCNVDIVPADFAASCDAEDVMVGETSVYVASPNQYGMEYQWLEITGSAIPGATSLTYQSEYGDVGAYPLKVRITKDGITKTSPACDALVVNCKPSEPYCKNNFLEEIQCVDDEVVINTTTEVCTDPRDPSGGGPDVQAFKFVPDTVATTTNYCHMNLQAENVLSCRLIKNDSVIDLSSYITNSVINIQSGVNIPVGTYQLGCTGSSTDQTYTLDYLFGTQRCILNPDFREF